MRYSINHIKLLMLTGVLVLASCDLEYELEVCDYNVLLRYDYNEENSTSTNMIEYYVYTIDEYIFDEAGILFEQRRITPDVCRELMDSEWELPPGRYTVIAVGNRDERSRCFDQSTGNEPVPGETRRDDMRLILDNATQMPGDTKGNSEPLYHGYRSFTVKEQGISRIRVDMINAHLQLRFRVTWRNGDTPPTGSNYYALLADVPSFYDLMPQYIYPKGMFEIEEFNSLTYDDYPSESNDVIHHIPFTSYQNANRLVHRNDTKINVDKVMWGEFLTYRVKMATAPVLKIYDNTGKQIVKDIRLREYFEWYEYQPDYTLKQLYEIEIIIDGDNIILMPLNMADWDEGGYISGK